MTNFVVNSRRVVEQDGEKFLKVLTAEFGFTTEELPEKLVKLGEFLAKNGVEDFKCELKEEMVELEEFDGQLRPKKTEA